MTDDQINNDNQKSDSVKNANHLSDSENEVLDIQEEVDGVKKSLFHGGCKKCENLKKESEEYKLGWQRALADYNNLQKETKSRMSEWIQMSELQILEEFIPVYDNFKKAFAHHPELDTTTEEGKRIKNWVDGIGYIMKQFGEVLKNHKVEEIKTVGEKFDPKMHETVGEEEVEGKEQGEIIKEMDGGYTMGERVVKVAKVIIVK